jgi:hypothetical protein
VVVGLAVLPLERRELVAPAPTTAYDPMHDDRAAAPARYAGTRLASERWAGGGAVAVRVVPWVAVGASLLAARTRVAHERTVWLGTEGAGALADLSPAADAPFGAEGTGWSPVASVGLVAAPPDLPLELALTAAHRSAVSLAGAPHGGVARDGAAAGQLSAEPGAGATLDLGGESRAGGGARLLLGQVAVELDGEWLAGGGEAPAWRTTGLSASAGGASADVSTVPIAAATGDRVAVRAALEVVCADGAITLSAGYAFVSAALPDAGATAVSPGGATHTLAAGIEARVERARVSLGVAHDLGVTTQALPGDARVLAPLTSLDAAAAAGTTRAGATAVALGVELDLGLL